MLNALYTMCYKDVLELCPSLLDDLSWDTPEHTQLLKEMIYNKFFNYEISGETLEEQKLFMTAKFNEYRDYYSELLSVYEQEIEWLNGVISGDNVEEWEYNHKTFTPRSEYEVQDNPGVVRTTEDYDLPRSTSSENRPSSKSVNTPSGYDSSTSKGVAGDDQTIDDNKRGKEGTSFSGNPVDQKNKMLKLIRSVYSEFADKFKPCFITLFS